MTTSTVVPAASRYRQELRRYGRARDHRSTLRRIVDSSDVLFGGAMIVGLASGGLSELLRTSAPSLGAQGTSPWLIAVLTVLSVTLVLKGMLAFGPVLADSATATWLLASPVDRRSVLLRPFLLAAAASVVGGALLFVVLSVFAEVNASGVPVVAAIGGSTGLLTVSLATIVQRVPAMVVRAQRFLLAAVALEVVLVAAVTLLAPQRTASRGFPFDVLVIALGVVVVAATTLTALAVRCLGRFTRAALIDGARLADAARTAAIWLDPTLLAATVVANRTRVIGRVRSQRFRGGRTEVLLRAEWARLWRGRLELSVWAALIVLPYVAAEILPFGAVAPAHLVAAFLATERLASGLRTVARSAALRQTLGGTDRRLRMTHLVVPALGALVWCTATLPALPIRAPIVAPISFLGAVAVTYRMATRQSMDYTSPILDTPFGIVPVNIVRQVMRGPGLLAILVLVQFLITT